MMITPEQKYNNINNLANTKPKKSFLGALIWYISFIIIIPLIAHVSNVNRLRRLNTKVSEAESGIDVQLKKRRDTLIKLIDSVKSGIKFEKETLTTLTAMRTGVGLDEMQKNASMLNKVAKDVSIQLENYPDLKSTALVADLMAQTGKIEDDISASRRIYNSNVSIFNQEINIYPKNIAAGQLGYVFKSFFEITEEERADVEISF
ncbi:LemA protein [Spiroplasma chinense]|uniref:LemA protein n=1 Tax=Spiroplasma chinense TaxID=216932 RepID=A0A5B9Y7Q2_9MOLU|nr:LemA family protein [Spiroplasma chinense]QEH62122.1 LemA protein [Spiroplasma chinense]